MVICGLYMIIHVPYMIIQGPYMVTHGPCKVTSRISLNIYGPCMTITDTYMMIYGSYRHIFTTCDHKWSVYDYTWFTYDFIWTRYGRYMIVYGRYMIIHRTHRIILWFIYDDIIIHTWSYNGHVRSTLLIASTLGRRVTPQVGIRDSRVPSKFQAFVLEASSVEMGNVMQMRTLLRQTVTRQALSRAQAQVQAWWRTEGRPVLVLSSLCRAWNQLKDVRTLPTLSQTVGSWSMPP